MRAKKTFIGFAVVTMAACGTLNHPSDYASTRVTMQTFDDRTFRIFDKPASSRLMIAPTLGASAEDEIVRAVTLGFADDAVPEPTLRGAVESYLLTTGRNCKTHPAQQMSATQWEFRYECECQIGWSLERCRKP